MNTIMLVSVVLLMITGLLYAALDMLLGVPFNFIGLMVGLLFWISALFMIGIQKSPMWSFMNAAYSGRPLLKIRRKDGTLVWERVTESSDGILMTKKYGIFMISPKDPGSVDSKSGANYSLSPKELNVTLTKIGEKPQSNIILIDAEKFQDIKWIRIKCADYEREDIINFE